MPNCVQYLYDSNMKVHDGIVLAQGLFGESTLLPDVVHCETIAARSSLYDWELAAHRHDRLHQVILLQAGAGVAHLDGGAHPCGPMTLINVPPGIVHAFSFEPDSQGFVVTLADEVLDFILTGVGDVRYTLGQPLVCPAERGLSVLVQQIWHEFNSLTSARALILRSLCATLLGLVARTVSQSGPADAKLEQTNFLKRFEALVEDHFLEHWGVADYARVLSISPTHLGRIVRAATGEAPSQRINARVLREARRKLAYTNLRVSSIAYELGFADPAHFSRVFTRAAGVSPRTFRNQVAGPHGAAAAPTTASS